MCAGQEFTELVTPAVIAIMIKITIMITNARTELHLSLKIPPQFYKPELMVMAQNKHTKTLGFLVLSCEN